MEQHKTNRRHSDHGLAQDHCGQDQPTDKSRAQQVETGDEAAGEKAQRDPTTEQPEAPGELAGGE